MVSPNHDDVAARALRALGGPATPPADLADRAFRASVSEAAPGRSSFVPSFVDELVALARPAAALACSAALVLLAVAAATSSPGTAAGATESDELAGLGLPSTAASLDEVAAEILPAVLSGGSRT